MKRSIHKLKAVHTEIKRRKKARTKAIKNSVSRWMDRSKDFVGTLPTLNELREEFADWHSFEAIDPEEIGLSRRGMLA
jgi:hypothetical protein